MECVAQTSCDQSSIGFGLDCGSEDLVRFNTQLGRCERVETCPRAGTYTTIEECWQTCVSDGGGMCLEDWRPLSGDTPSEVNGLSASAVVAALEREFSAQVRYLSGAPSTIHLELSDVQVFEVQRVPNPNFSLDIVPSCFPEVIAEARAELFTDDGQLAESWQRLRLIAESETLYTFRVHVVVPEDRGNPVGTVRLSGDYVPAPDPEHCLLGTTLSGTLQGEAFSGEVFHLRSTRPCGDPLGAITSSGNDPTNGPVWSPQRP